MHDKTAHKTPSFSLPLQIFSTLNVPPHLAQRYCFTLLTTLLFFIRQAVIPQFSQTILYRYLYAVDASSVVFATL